MPESRIILHIWRAIKLCMRAVLVTCMLSGFLGLHRKSEVWNDLSVEKGRFLSRVSSCFG